MKKIAIVNRTNLLNYGSVLQVLALAEAVKVLGYDSEVIWEGGSVSKHLDLRPQKIFSILFKLLRYPRFIPITYKDLKSVRQTHHSEETVSMFKNFVERNISRRFFEQKEFKRIGKSNLYAKYLCGSDQIWCTTTLYPDPLMYLRFTTKDKRIAYAPSLGRSYIPEYNRHTLKRYIDDIPWVSVRETDGSKLIKQLTGKDVPVVLDPTLLFNKSFWESYSSSIDMKDYVLCYFLDEPSIDVQKEIIRYAEGKKIVTLRSQLSYMTSNYNNLVSPNAGPGEFLGFVRNADFIFTDSYHGMLFSINFEKDFLSVERNYGEFDQSTRQRSILELLDIEDCYNNSGHVITPAIDYAKIRLKLDNLRQDSMNYLRSALNH